MFSADKSFDQEIPLNLSPILNPRVAAAGAAAASLLLSSVAVAVASGTGPFQPANRNALAVPSEIVFPDFSGNLNAPGSANPMPIQFQGNTNTDASANAPSLSGLNLLGTLVANTTRKGFVVQTQDNAADCGGSGGLATGMPVVFDDNGSNTTVIIVSYAAVKGGQGASVSWSGMPHTGRIRYYGTAGCQVGAAQW
jgi:hypothetical protein